MRIVSLFSGIGGLELGFKWAGLGEVVAQVELDPLCHQVLERNWPRAKRFFDIRHVSASDFAPSPSPALSAREASTAATQAQAESTGFNGGPAPASASTTDTLYCGGFPCQDISRRGSGHGIHGAQSGLWAEYRRLVAEGRPRWVVIDNSAQLVRRGLAVVLADLAALGYAVWWDCIPAAAVGAPHLRDRVFIVARLAYAARPVLGAKGQGKHPGPPKARKQARTDDRGGSLCTAQRDCESRLARLGDGFPARLYESPRPTEAPRTAAPPPGFRKRHRMIGNAVVPQAAYVIGCAIKQIITDEENQHDRV